MDQREEKPHDVLAAEEFGIGTRDERFPPDPTGEQEAHDVLAAEEFAMPAGGEVSPSGGISLSTLVPPLILAALLAALLVLRRRRRS